MLLSDLIATLQEIKNKHGDLPVVSGLRRVACYGESVCGANVIEAHPYDGDVDGYAENTEKVVFLMLSDDSSHSSSAG